MATYHYRAVGETKWQGQSGSAILAIVNKPGSNKKINVNTVELYTNTYFGAQITADSFTSPPGLFDLISVSNLSGGYPWTPVKLDTSASDWPATVLVRTNTAYTPIYEDVTGSLTDSTVAVGDTTFTPDTSPSWVVDQHRFNGSILNVASGGNTGTYNIVSNTATALTIDPGFPSAGSTTGTVQRIARYTSTGVIKFYSPTSTPLAMNLGFGRVGQRSQKLGSIVTAGTNPALQRITVLAGESMALVVRPLHANLPIFVQLLVTRVGSPNRNYLFSAFTNVTTETEAVFSIQNQAGSGETIRINEISIAEMGTYDTPYFQLVPLGPIDPISFNDPDKKLSVVATDTNAPALSSSVCEIFTNSPALPTGVLPQSYIAEGSSATPRGYNYLNTKDFIGPAFMTVFPEVSPIKGTGYLGNWTATTPTNWALQSARMATIKGRGKPIVIRAGEQVGIVSGAETAVGVTVAQSGWHSFLFAINFSVEDISVPVTVTGIVPGDRVSMFKSIGPGSSEIDKSMFNVDQTHTAPVSYIRVEESIPADTPTSGIIRVVRRNGSGTILGEERYTYTSWSNAAQPNYSEFSLSGSTTIDYGTDDTAYVPYIDEEATATSITKNLPYVSNRNVVTKVRRKGILPFSITGVISSTGLTTTAIRSYDSIVD